MRDDMPVLFNEGQLRAVFDNQEAEMLRALDSISAQQFRTEDDSTIVASLTSKFAIQSIELTEGAISVDAQEAKVDVSGSWERDVMDRSRPYYVPGIAASYFVPFTGDRELFRFQPSTHSYHLPHGDVHENEIAFHFERPDAATMLREDASVRSFRTTVPTRSARNKTSTQPAGRNRRGVELSCPLAKRGASNIAARDTPAMSISYHRKVIFLSFPRS